MRLPAYPIEVANICLPYRSSDYLLHTVLYFTALLTCALIIGRSRVEQLASDCSFLEMLTNLVYLM